MIRVLQLHHSGVIVIVVVVVAAVAAIATAVVVVVIVVIIVVGAVSRAFWLVRALVLSRTLRLSTCMLCSSHCFNL